MNRWNRGLSLFVGIVIVSLMLVGCGKSNTTTDPITTGTSNGTGETDNQEINWNEVKADIRFVWPGTTEIEKELGERFKERMKDKYPNVNIEFMFLSWQDMETKLAVMINSGDAPDLTMTQDVSNLVLMDGLEDLTPYFEKEKATLTKDSFLPGTLEYSSVDGGIYAVPQLGQVFNLIVNEKMLQDVGMKAEDLKTWEDIEKAASLMTKDGKYGFAYPLGVSRFAWRVPFTVAYSNDLKLDDTSAESENKYKETLQHFKNLEAFQPKAHVTWGYPEMFRAFSNEEVGMVAAGSFYSSQVYSINPDILKVSKAIVYPKGPSGSGAKAPTLNVGYGIFKDSKNKEVAWRLIEEITMNEFNANQAAITHFSAIKNVDMDEGQKFLEKVYPNAIEDHKRITAELMDIAAEYGEEAVKIKGQPEMEEIFQSEIVKYLSDKIDIEEAYTAIKQGIDGVKAKLE